MAPIFEAPAAHEGVHETAHEWEWENPDTHEVHESHEAQEWEWEHLEAHEPEDELTWAHPGVHEAQEWEWEHLEAHEPEDEFAWAHPGAHEAQEWEWEHLEAHEPEDEFWHPEAQEWESEADPFFGAFKGLAKGLGGIAKRLAPGAIRALASMIPGGAIAAPMLGQLTQSILQEGEAMAAEAEAEAFGGSQGEAEVGHSEMSHEAALAELLAAEAAMAGSEAEAASITSAALPLTITIMRADRAVRPVVPVLIQANARVARTLARSGPQGRQLLRAMPHIHRVTVGSLKSAARSGRRVTPQLAVGAMAAATRRVLGDPRRVEAVVNRNLALRQRTAPPHPRRALVYQPQRRAPYHRRRSAWDRAPF
jgi:hypothetical protein